MNDTRMRVWMALFVALVFICGLAMGVAAGLWVGTRANVWALGPPPPPERGPERGRRGFGTERLLNRLAQEDPDFTNAQRAQLEALFEARRQAFVSVAREMRERYAEEQERLRENVAEILTPEQMEIFDTARQRLRRGPGRGRDRPRSDR